MAKRIAKFSKVSFCQFETDFTKAFPNYKGNDIKDIYDTIKLPKRGTIGSAGYDFFTPISFTLSPGETILIPTGIRCKIDEDWVLKLYPRSGHGFKFRLQLNNTVGIIDSDYYNAKNEGHIMARITNDTNENKVFAIENGKGFMQGVFVEYGITVDDEADGVRVGGFGSTEK